MSKKLQEIFWTGRDYEFVPIDPLDKIDQINSLKQSQNNNETTGVEVPETTTGVQSPEQTNDTTGSEVVIPSPTVEPSGTGNSGNASGSGTGSNEVETNTDTAASDKAVDNYLDTEIYNVLQQIFNREKFSYDMNGDALYQQYADIYQNQADLAMQNAMAQSAAMTGGYGSSYAQSAGQQAYAQQMQNLNAVGMDLYDRAYAQNQDEQQALYDQLSMLYGMKQDEEATNQWHATYGQYEYDDNGNIIGTTGGLYNKTEPTEVVYNGGGVLQGQSVPTQLQNIPGLTTLDTTWFDENGNFKKAEFQGETSDGKMSYRINGKTVVYDKGENPYTQTVNPDCQYGTFSNGYQPNNVNGSKLSKTGDTDYVNGVLQNIWEDEEGNRWIWDGTQNKYLDL